MGEGRRVGEMKGGKQRKIYNSSKNVKRINYINESTALKQLQAILLTRCLKIMITVLAEVHL